MRITLALALFAAPCSAWAATGDIGCIEGKLGPAAMQRIGVGIVAATDEQLDLGGALDADRASLLAGRDACRVANAWSPDAVQLAVSYTQARATLLGAETALKADGLDAKRLAASYAALPIADRQSLIGRASTPAIKAVRAAGTTEPTRRHALLYFAALAAIEFYPVEFAAA